MIKVQGNQAETGSLALLALQFNLECAHEHPSVRKASQRIVVFLKSQLLHLFIKFQKIAGGVFFQINGKPLTQVVFFRNFKPFLAGGSGKKAHKGHQIGSVIRVGFCAAELNNRTVQRVKLLQQKVCVILGKFWCFFIVCHTGITNSLLKTLLCRHSTQHRHLPFQILFGDLLQDGMAAECKCESGCPMQ